MDCDIKFPYTKIKTVSSSAKENQRLGTGCLIGFDFYIICDKEKCGVGYNHNDWNMSVMPNYEVLIECVWDEIKIFDTDYGAYIIVYLNGCCGCFSVSAELELIRDGENHWWSSIKASATKISDCICDNIVFDSNKSANTLFFYRNGKESLYDLEHNLLIQ